MSFYNVFDSVQEGVIVIDREGKAHYANPSASTMFDLSVRRLSSGKPLSQMITFTPDPISKESALETVTDVSQLQEIQYALTDGRAGTVQVIFQAEPKGFSDSTEPRWIMAMRDVTLEKVLDAKYKLQLDQKESVISDLRKAREELEVYSKNLESMVAERTLALSDTNTLLKSILDSLGQGIMVFDKSGTCLNVYSQVCVRLFGVEPAGKLAEDSLAFKGDSHRDFGKWREAVFSDMLEFYDMAPLAPSKLPARDDLDIFLTYHPIREETGNLNRVVVVATDKTEEVKAQKQAVRDRQLAERVIQVSRNPETYRLFASESKRALIEISNWPASGVSHAEIARWVHTVKGGAASFSLQSVVHACDRYEDELAVIMKSAAKQTSISDAKSAETISSGRVTELAKNISDALTQEIQEIAELLGTKAEIDSEESAQVSISVASLQKWYSNISSAKNLESLTTTATEIQSEYSERPIKVAIQHFEQSLTQLALANGKKLDAFVIEGGDLKAPIYIVKEFVASLVHAFNNSICHGLETPEQRIAAGKPEGGKIVAKFTQAASLLKIDISDDGKGLDPEKIRTKFQTSGSDIADHLNNDEILQLILRDNFSTAESISSVAGRGVGLSAIAGEVKRLGGTMRVQSVKGQGMTLAIEIPLNSQVTTKSPLQAA
jgi:two-component system, chemotaxis family, sensor kinase CheA